MGDFNIRAKKKERKKYQEKNQLKLDERNHLNIPIKCNSNRTCDTCCDIAPNKRFHYTTISLH